MLIGLFRLSYEFLLVALVWQLLTVWYPRWKRWERRWQAVRQERKKQRKWRAKTSEDCPLCQCTQGEEGCASSVEAWSARKSRRGRPKHKDSTGRACWNVGCMYYGERDGRRHALHSHGTDEQGQPRWCCGACGATFSDNAGTALAGLQYEGSVVLLALKLSCLGLSRRAISCVLEVDERTVQNWLERAASHCEALHAAYCVEQKPRVVQLDELFARLRGALKSVWVWLAIDCETKVILAQELGSRKTATAMAFVHGLVQTLAPGFCPLFLSDGLAAYFHALTAHFGYWVLENQRRVWRLRPELLYAQVVKILRWRRLVAIFPRVLVGSIRPVRQHLQAAGFSGQVQTAFIERLNLTLRHSIAPLARRSWGTYRSPEQLRLHLELFRGSYHFCRVHGSLTLRDADDKRIQRTPAMAAGWTDHVWTFEELLTHPVGVR